MTIGQFIAIMAIIVPSATALIVGYWHRKQIRQIEAFRQNPEVGLRPPDSRIYTFIKTNRTLLVGVGLPATSLTLELLKSTPITRSSLFIVSLTVSSMLFSILLYFFERVLEILENQIDILKSQSNINRDFVEIIKKANPLTKKAEKE
jgi:hypothetical protein